MKLSRFSLIQMLLLIVYIITSYVIILKAIQPELHYHLQQPPFLGIYEFFNQYTLYPGGISDYVATFCMQFFYIPWLGSIVIIFNSLLILSLAYYILKQICTNESALIIAWVPFILSVSLLNSYTIPYTIIIKILFSYLLFYIYLRFKNKRYSIFLYTLLALAIYYIAGSGSFLTFSASVLIIELYRNRERKNIIYIIYIAAFSALIPFLSYKYVFNIPPSAKYLYFLPDLPKFLAYSSNSLFYIFCYSLPIITSVYIILSSITKNNAKTTNYQKWLVSKSFNLIFATIFIATISIITFNITRNGHAKDIVLADYYSYNERWDKVIDIAKEDPQYDVFINYQYNRAIINTPFFVDSYFNYKQYIGADGLFPDKYNAKEIALVSSDYYYDLGYIGLSQLWANEALTAFHYGPRVLKRLFTTNLILGNYDEARKYIEILNENFLYKDLVEQNEPYLEDTMLIYKNKTLMEKKHSSPYKMDVSGNNMPSRFNDLLNTNFNNKAAFDHLQMYYLLKIRLEDFYKNIAYTFNYYKKMPETYELATIAYLVQTKKFELINNKNFSTNAIRTFSEYIRILKENGNDKKLAQNELSSQFGNTYLYYMMFDSPLVTKYELKQQPTNTQKY